MYFRVSRAKTGRAALGTLTRRAERVTRHEDDVAAARRGMNFGRSAHGLRRAVVDALVRQRRGEDRLGRDFADDATQPEQRGSGAEIRTFTGEDEDAHGDPPVPRAPGRQPARCARAR